MCRSRRRERSVGDVGERRTVKWSPAGLHFGDATDLDAYMQACVVDNFPEGCDPNAERDEVRERLTQHIHSKVAENYAGLTKELASKL